MRILVTFAVDAEFAPWRKLRSFHKSSGAGTDYFSTKIGDDEINVLLTGIGCRRSWLEATKVLWSGGVGICISSGLAGGLRDDHRLREILVAENVLASKWDKAIPCDPALVESAVAIGAKRVKAFYTADHVILKSNDKRSLSAFADAVEMESGEVLLETAALGAKVVAIRSISDTVDEDLPLDFNKVADDSGDVSMRRIVGAVAAAPASIPALVRFGRQSRNAAESLAVFLEKYLQVMVAAPFGVRS